MAGAAGELRGFHHDTRQPQCEALHEQGLQGHSHRWQVVQATLRLQRQDKILSSKRYVIECISDTLKNTETLVHSRHRPINNFIMNHVSALGAYCFYDNKQRTLLGFYVFEKNQLPLF